MDFYDISGSTDVEKMIEKEKLNLCSKELVEKLDEILCKCAEHKYWVNQFHINNDNARKLIGVLERLGFKVEYTPYPQNGVCTIWPRHNEKALSVIKVSKQKYGLTLKELNDVWSKILTIIDSNRKEYISCSSDYKLLNKMIVIPFCCKAVKSESIVCEQIEAKLYEEKIAYKNVYYVVNCSEQYIVLH